MKHLFQNCRSILALICTMLCMQVAVAAHDLEHSGFENSGFEHTESCSVYNTADNSGVIVATEQREIVVESVSTQVSKALPQFHSQAIHHYASRAPPIL